MPAMLLDSQLSTLEMPSADENAIAIDINQKPASIVAEALAIIAKEKS